LSFSNFPPACRTVKTISNADFPYFGCISVGIPLPLSTTSMILSGRIFTSILSQYPAKASSTELSTISHTKWCSPLSDVVPIYIPGLFLTASNPSRTVIFCAS